jgi:threonine synthase
MSSADPAAEGPQTFRCTNCGRSAPASRPHYECQTCGGTLGFAEPLPFDPLPAGSGHGLERFRQSFPLPPGSPWISLGEGGTPLLTIPTGRRDVFAKCEFMNPTGSFKDRGSSVLVSALAGMGVREAVEDSSGNAGASFAAYAARAGMRARIFVPESAAGPKRQQIAAYGAEVVAIPGPRSAAARAVREAAVGQVAYASHAHMPHNLAGYATAAFEIVEQLGDVPGTVVVPVGQGGLLLGLDLGFESLRAAGRTDKIPRLVGVQARACAPIWAVHAHGAAGLVLMREGETVAEGIRIAQPLRGDAVLQAVERSGGAMSAVDEEAILPARDALARCGLHVEPTSAVVWAALPEILPVLPDPVVLMLTGSGLKAVSPRMA